MERVFGTYLLHEPIGSGGMGEVFLATRRGADGFGARVALKLILPHLAREPSFRRLFSREARLAALLRHPNIVRVNGFDILDGTPFIEMEYVEGMDLASLLQALGPKTLPLEEAVHILHGISRGLDHAHSFRSSPAGDTGILHRDLSPHNVLISVEGEVKVADFGIARAAKGGRSDSGTPMGRMGKVSYMSPEQLEGTPLDHRSDLFSLGTTAFQLLSGIHPFQRAGEAGILRAVQEARHPPLSQFRADLPASLLETVESLLAHSPEERLSSAAVVAERLEGLLRPSAAKNLGRRVCSLLEPSAGSPAGRRTAPTLFRSPRKRFRSPAAAGIVVLFVLIGILIPTQPGTLREQEGRRPAPPEPAPATPIAVPVDSVPSGARVGYGDTVLGLTPLTITLSADNEGREITVSKESYQTVQVRVTRADAARGILMPLRPLPTGTIRIGAIPWARVRFQDRELGLTPVVIEDVPVGKQRFVLSNDELGIRRDIEVAVTEGLNPVYVLDLGTGRRIGN